MQIELASLLNQKSHLAALGLAVSKVSHDLRNMLSSAHLISDRLSMVNDPTVQKFAPKLIASLDRAISLCVQTLKYGRAEEALPRRDKFLLRLLVDEVIESIAVEASSRIVLYNNVPQNLSADADRDQLFRILTNLVRNAAQALETPRERRPRLSEGAITTQGLARRHDRDGRASPTTAPASPNMCAAGCSKRSRVRRGRAAPGSASPSPPNWCAPMAAQMWLDRDRARRHVAS